MDDFRDIFNDLPYMFNLIDGRTIVGTVDKRETVWTTIGHPMVLSLKVPDPSPNHVNKRTLVPWHSVVTYEKVR